MTSGWRSGSRTRQQGRRSSALASAPWFLRSTSFCSPVTPGAVTCCATWWRPARRGVESPGLRLRVCLRQRPQREAPVVRLVQSDLGDERRSVRATVLDGLPDRPEADLMAGAERFDYDVLITGAGGAGLRAAIEAAAAGVKVGLICKSLLGKAHTVMAEGGMAAALAHNDDRDSWHVHFADTMRGGQYVNNWRMAELHAKEAPDRVRELEAWGAVFDRTPDGRINQRNFGGHRYPRLAHVGDRTGLELIRTLQDHTVYLGVTVHMEHTIVDLLLDATGHACAALATTGTGGASSSSRRRPSCSPPAA